MDEKDVLATEFKTVKLTISGRDYLIGKLTALQILKLSALIVKTTKDIKSRKVDTSGKTTLEDILNILSSFKEEELSEFTSILLNEPDMDFCKNIPFEDLTEVVATIVEQNDTNAILKNVQRVANKLQQLKTPLRQ